MTAAWRTSTSGSVLASDRSRSEEHTSELQSRGHLVCRLLLEKKNEPPRSRARRQVQGRATTRIRRWSAGVGGRGANGDRHRQPAHDASARSVFFLKGPRPHALPPLSPPRALPV